LNTCSNIATPCRSFSGGITQVDPGGEVIVIDSGSYGGVTITKSVAVNVPPGVVAFTAQPIVINGGVNDVITLRGLTSKALTFQSNNGINFNSGAALHIENCVFSSWGMGLSVNAAGKISVRDSIFRDNDRGIQASANSGLVQISVDGSRFDHNGTGGFVTFGNVRASLRHCSASGNGNGILLATATGTDLVDLESCDAEGNGTGVATSNSGPGTVRLSNCSITGNTTGIDITGGFSMLSRSNNTIRDNGADRAGSALTLYSAD
jgi:hypothetical protein